jgi:hypothetical protein
VVSTIESGIVKQDSTVLTTVLIKKRPGWFWELVQAVKAAQASAVCNAQAFSQPEQSPVPGGAA